MAKGGNGNPYVKGANGAEIKNGETFLQFLPYDDPNVVYNQAGGEGDLSLSSLEECVK